MILEMQALRPLTNLAARNGAFFARSYHGPSNFHMVFTMNEMPVPEGDFFEQHRRKKRTYNAVLAAWLAARIIIFGITATLAKESGLINRNHPAFSVASGGQTSSSEGRS
ncbi:AAEL006164-PA [Aedes aegypti]|uniref:AAEL006164-PA n=1 Tax=Aedes aegypti TaxID=7159 RepID=Q177E7_AEDAE|nr:AAEL006164-PA [Aedes aegypti]